jgi:hypothetical protein
MNEKDRRLKEILMELVLVSGDTLDAHEIFRFFDGRPLLESKRRELCKTGMEKTMAIHQHLDTIIKELKAMAENSN